MDHGRLRELEWQRDDLWQRLCARFFWVDDEGFRELHADYEVACAELQRAL